MSSLDVRNNSAVMKRAEQLKRWEESETNREPGTPRAENGRRIKFSSGCVFLAACLAGDKEEVLNLLEHGADINTANVDGLTALHQACIDDNLEMVEFLVEHGADINRQDNEGWTPLHATASCGFVSIARYLVENGADVAAVNSDGDLAVDLASDIQNLAMMDFMQQKINERQIDCEKARKAEEQLMLSDAKKWLRSDASEIDRPHPKTGATALHVAAAKGYTKVLSLLLAGRADVDKQDNDGWTPLHAAAHWGQKEAAEMVVDAMADMDIRNYAGQTCIDVADRKMMKFLEDLRANNKRIKRRPSSQIRISDAIENHIEKTPTKIIRVEVKPDQIKDQVNEDKYKLASDGQKPSAGDSAMEDEAPWRRNSLATRARIQNETPTKNQVPEREASKANATTASSGATTTTAEPSDVILRRTQSFENDEKFYQKYHELRARIKANSCPILPATQLSINNNNHSNNNNVNSSNNIGNSVGNNNKNSNANNNINNKAIMHNPNSAIGGNTNTNTKTSNTNTTNTSNTNTITTSSTSSSIFAPSTNFQNSFVQRSASFKDHECFRKPITTSSIALGGHATTSPPTTGANLQPATTVANAATTPPTSAQTTPIRRSFVPPSRDEESETQRKAHAKRVRETRRSTQGVTLDEIKSAEELVKKKNSTMNNNNNINNNNNSNSNDMQTTSSQQEQQQQPPPPSTSPPPPPTTTTTTTRTTTPTNTTTTTATKTTTLNSSKPDQTTVRTNEDDVLIHNDVANDDDDDDDVTATFTIVAPVIKNRLPSPSLAHNAADDVEVDEDDDDDDNDDDDDEEESVGNEHSASFTLRASPGPPKSVESSETSIAVAPPAIKIDEPSETHAQSNNAAPKTDTNRQHPTTPTGGQSERGRNFAPLPLQDALVQSGGGGGTVASPAQSATSTPTLDSPVRLREKRSIFDLDQASSLTLAEKLRNEANKYTNAEGVLQLQTEGDGGDGERDAAVYSVYGNYGSRRSLDSAMLPGLGGGSGGGGGTSGNGSGTGGGGGSSSTNHNNHAGSTAERRPSWRLKFDAGCKFKLEDATTGPTFPPNSSAIIPSAPAVIAAANLSSSNARTRINSAVHSSNQSLNSVGRPLSAPAYGGHAATSTSANDSHASTPSDRINDNQTTIIGSYATRRLQHALPATAAPTAADDKDNDKENENRTSLATQAVIQRRRKPKRRSTGVVHLDKDDLDPERQDSANDAEEKESGSERNSRSRLGSNASTSATDDNKSRDKSENGEPIDYKALWEAAKLENDKLKIQLKKKDEEAVQTRATLERFTNATTKNSLSEIEKRERRAMERKVSEMEEELKQLEAYKTENQRLKEENGALIRVISKLSK